MKQDLLKRLQQTLRGELSRTRRRKNRSPWVVGGLTVAFGLLFYRHARGLWTSILYLTGSIFED